MNVEKSSNKKRNSRTAAKRKRRHKKRLEMNRDKHANYMESLDVETMEGCVRLDIQEIEKQYKYKSFCNRQRPLRNILELEKKLKEQYTVRENINDVYDVLCTPKKSVKKKSWFFSFF